MQLESTLVSATVFTDRARITRHARLHVKPGMQRAEFGQLPLGLLPESLRASGRGSAQARLLGVSSHIENFVDTPAVSARELHQQRQDFEDRIAELNAGTTALQKEQSAIEGLLTQSERFARGIAKGTRSADEQIAIFASLRARHAAVLADGLTAGRQRREVEKELDRVRRQLQEHGSAQPRQRYVAVIELDVQSEGELELELKYMVHGASWRPLYDIRCSEGALDVRYQAQVTQNTGEDWPDVKLTLSTAQPSVQLDVPELDPWFVMPRPVPLPRAMKGSAPMAAMARSQVMETAAAPMSEELNVFHDMVVPTATVSDAGLALTYELPGTAQVPGNGDPRNVTISLIALKPRVDYVTVPKLHQLCFRRSIALNDSAFTLLPGEAALFEGDEFLGSSTLPQTAPGQELELALGVDERIRVERELTQREVDKTFLSDRRRTRFGYKITLESGLRTAQTVIVRDQLPVSRHEDIKVKLEVAEPKPATQSELNQLEWKVSVAPGSKQVIKFEFTLEHPRAMDVLGIT